MEMKFRWKTILAIVAMVLMANFILVETEAWARAGGGRSSSGSRGSRSYSAPVGPSSPSPSSRPSPGVRPGISPSPSGGFMRSPFAQGLAGGLAGGLIGNMLFGSRGYGAAGPGFGGSSIGLLDLILIGVGIYLLFRFLRRRSERLAYQSSGSMDYQQPSGYGGTIEQPVESYDQLEMSPEARNLQNGLEQIHRFDPVFNEVRFTETAQDLFFRIQAAWMNRSVEGAENILTDEMTATFLIEFAEMKQKGQINRLENIAIRRVEITEAWQESGNDFITVLFTANLLDYTVDDKNGQVVAGDQRNPVKFEEFWTFSRPSGHPQWALTAINQR